jgi:hypothetical protein
MEALICIAFVAILFYAHSVLKNHQLMTNVTRISNALHELGIDLKRLSPAQARLVHKLAIRRVLLSPVDANSYQIALECFFAVTVKAQGGGYRAFDREALSRALVVIATWGRQRRIRMASAQSALLSLSAYLFDLEKNGSLRLETTVTTDSFIEAQRILKSAHFRNFQRAHS